MNEIFFNPVGRLRSGWRFGIFVIVFVVISMTYSLVMAVAIASLHLAGSVRETLFYLVGNFLGSLFAILIGWGCNKLLEGLSFKALGCWIARNWFRDLSFGLGLGVFSILLASAIAFVVGGLSFQTNQSVETSAILSTLGISLAVFILGAIAEETLFRGYIFQTLARANLAWLAIVLTSVPFAIAHLGNPNASHISTINTALAGVWFGVAYLKTRNLWFPFGIHLTWNWVQGAFLGIPVSGLKQLTPAPILQAVESGPTWLTGGDYGIEGGLACTIAIIVTTLLIWLLPIFNPTEEMLALTNQENPKVMLA